MSDWLHNLPILWMTVVVFGLTYLITTAIQGLVTALAKGERARAFKAISAGMLSPLAIIFGYLSCLLPRRSGTITNEPMRRSIVKRVHSEPSCSSPLPFRV